MKENALNKLSVFVRQNSHGTHFGSSDSWVILSRIEKQIRQKLELVGIPLRELDIRINFGVKTGFNEAFLINEAKRNELISLDPKSEEIIRPILRGRDIRRFAYSFAELYVISTFPSLKIDIDDYPAIKDHLLSFGYDRLKQTGEIGSRKKTNNKWFETQDSIGYWEDFDRQKIIWGEISDKAKFALDVNGEFTAEATTFILVGSSLLYLMGYLNSRFAEYLFSQIGTTTGVGTVRWKKFTIERLLVPVVSEKLREKVESITRKIIERQSQQHSSDDLEKEMNSLIYRSIGLTASEIELIETSGS